MTQLELPEAPLEGLTLALERRVLLGSATKAPEEQDDRIAVGRPVCIPLDLATVDADARVFLESRSTSMFWLLALTCSFRAVDDEPIEQAWLEARLTSAQPEGTAAPTAWSMEPLSLSDPLQVSNVVTLDASLKLTTPVVPVEIGPSASRERTTSFEARAPFLEAHREGTSRPSWIFNRTPVTEVRGVHRLRAVVEVPAGSTAQAEISVGASLRLKLLGIIPYRARLDRLPDLQTVRIG